MTSAKISWLQKAVRPALARIRRRHRAPDQRLRLSPRALDREIRAADVWKRALRSLQLAREGGGVTAQDLEVALAAAARVSRDEALAIISAMRHARVEVDVRAYQLLFGAGTRLTSRKVGRRSAGKDRWQQALLDFQLAQEDAVTVDQQAAPTLLWRACRGNWDLGHQLLLDLQRRGCQLGERSFIAAMEGCINSDVNCRDAAENALELYTLAQESGVAPSPSILRAAGLAFERGRQWTRALELLSGLGDRGPSHDIARVKSSVIRTCSKVGKWQAALWLLLGRPLEGSLQDDEVRGDVGAYVSCSVSCLAANKLQESTRILEALERRWHPTNRSSAGGNFGSGSLSD